MHVMVKVTWMDPLLDYLRDNKIFEDRSEVRLLRLQMARYLIYDGKLYRQGFIILLVRCTMEEKTAYMLKEVYEDICGNHSRGPSFSTENIKARVLLAHNEERRMGLYEKKKCDKCQRFAPMSHLPAQLLTPIISPWSFAI